MGFGAGVVFEPEPDLVVVLFPDAVSVGVGSLAEGGGGAGGGPPAGQPRSGNGAGVGEEVDEDLACAVVMLQMAARGDRFAVFPLGFRAGDGPVGFVGGPAGAVGTQDPVGF